MTRTGLALAVALAALAVAAPTAGATFPGKPGKINFFSLDRQDDQTLYSINPSGGKVRHAPVDGGYIAYSADGRSVAYSDGTLWVADADGGNARQLVASNAYDPAWSPDGRRIVYTRTSDEDYPYLEIFDLATGTSKFLVSGGKPSWSPDGKLIVFGTPNDGALCFIRPDGSGERCPAAASKLRARDADWSPGGRAIVVSAGTRIAVLRKDGTFARWISPPIKNKKGTLWTQVFSPVWSPDGRSVVYERGKGYSRGSLIVTSDRGGRQRHLTGGVRPVWAPRG